MNFKISKKALNDAKKGIAKNNAIEKKSVKNDRKGLKATIAYIATTDTHECQILRNFLNLPKNANKAERNEACDWVKNHYINAVIIRNVISDYDAVEIYNTIEPSSAKGKIKSDFIDVIFDIKSNYERIASQRSYVAKNMIKTRAILIEKDDYMERIQNVINQSLSAPKKIKTNIVDTIVNRMTD